MRAAGVGDRAHVRLVAVLHVRVHHVKVALVDREVNRLTNRAAGVVNRIGGVGQFHKILEVGDGGVATAMVQVAHKRRAVGRCEHGVFATDDHVVGRVAGVLGELTGGRCLNQRAAHATGHAHPLALHVRTGLAPDVQGLGVIAKINADLFQNGVGIVLNDGQTLFVQHLVIGDFAGDVGHGVATAGTAGGAFGFAASGGAAVAGGCSLRCCSGLGDFVHVVLQACARECAGFIVQSIDTLGAGGWPLCDSHLRVNVTVLSHKRIRAS